MLTLLAFLLLCSALISGSEVAYFSLTPQQLDDLKREGDRINRRVLTLRMDSAKLLATILVGNNFVNIAIVLVSNFLTLRIIPANTFMRWSEALAKVPLLELMSAQGRANAINFAITTVLVSFLLVLFGEVAPKIYAKINNVRLAKFMSGPLVVMRMLFGPVSSVLVAGSDRIEKRLGNKTGGFLGAHKDEIDAAIDLTVSQTSDQDSRMEAGILKSIIKFNDVAVKQIMRSRVDVISADIEMSFDELLDLISSSGYSRIPVYEEDFDNIVGILYAKDLLTYRNKGKTFAWQALIRPQVMYAPESKKINDLLKSFQAQRVHMAVVVDEYGGTSGIVTLEDVMEEVIGEIKDEFDATREGDYKKIDRDTFLFDGKMLINDVCRILGVDSNLFDEIRGDADSIAGLILEMNGDMPEKGEEFESKGLQFKVASVAPRRIEKIRVKRLTSGF